MRAYQALANPPSIFGFLRPSYPMRALGASNIRVSYNGGDYMSLLPPNSFAPNGNSFTQVGVTVAYKEGLLEVFAVFI